MESAVYDEFIERTLKPVISITLSDEETTPYQSKVGGTPYWPKGQNIEEMQFLAQINFEELPKNVDLPKMGILQFFIGNDYDLGLEDNKFKVIYHKEIGESEEIELPKPECTPIEKPGKMNFEKYTEPMSYSDYRFPLDDESVYDNSDLDGSGSKILGYPYFTQSDPRENPYRDFEKYDTLLFQLDSGDEYIMWGDLGVGNFFINGEALRQGDFSDILYNWDCC